MPILDRDDAPNTFAQVLQILRGISQISDPIHAGQIADFIVDSETSGEMELDIGSTFYQILDSGEDGLVDLSDSCFSTPTLFRFVHDFLEQNFPAAVLDYEASLPQDVDQLSDEDLASLHADALQQKEREIESQWLQANIPASGDLIEVFGDFDERFDGRYNNIADIGPLQQTGEQTAEVVVTLKDGSQRTVFFSERRAMSTIPTPAGQTIGQQYKNFLYHTATRATFDESKAFSDLQKFAEKIQDDTTSHNEKLLLLFILGPITYGTGFTLSKMTSPYVAELKQLQLDLAELHKSYSEFELKNQQLKSLRKNYDQERVSNSSYEAAAVREVANEETWRRFNANRIPAENAKDAAYAKFKQKLDAFKTKYSGVAEVEGRVTLDNARPKIAAPTFEELALTGTRPLFTRAGASAAAGKAFGIAMWAAFFYDIAEDTYHRFYPTDSMKIHADLTELLSPEFDEEKFHSLMEDDEEFNQDIKILIWRMKNYGLIESAE